MLRKILVVCAVASVSSVAVAQEPIPTPGEVRTCYVGTSSIVMDDGSLMPLGDVAVERILVPERSQIIEYVTNSSMGTSETFEVVLHVEGNTMRFAFNGLTGTGTLVGEPWAWTSWETVTVFPDGMTVTSTDTLTETGIVSEKVVEAGGAVVARIHDEVIEAPCPFRIAAEPVGPGSMPTEPASMPTEPASMPTEPASMPTEPAFMPTE